MPAQLLVPLGLGPTLLMANLSLIIQPKLPPTPFPIPSSPQYSPFSIQIANWSFPLRIRQDGHDFPDGQFAASLLDDGRELRLHLDCLNKTGGVVTPQNICQSLLGTDQTAALIVDAADHPLPFDCIQNVTLNGRLLLSSWCPKSTAANPTRSLSIRNVRLLDVHRNGEEEAELEGRRRRLVVEAGERLRVNTGESVPIGWSHLRLIHPPNWVGRGDIVFEVLDGPGDGQILLADGSQQKMPVRKFTYADVLGKRVFYENFGASSSRHDFFKLKMDTRRVARKAARRTLAVRRWEGDFGGEHLTLDVDVQQPTASSNRPPQIVAGPFGPTIHMKPGTRLKLDDAHLRVFDEDTPPDRVWLHLEEISPNLDIVDRTGMRLRRFSLLQFANGDVQMLATDDEESEAAADIGIGTAEGQATFIARDEKGGQSTPFTLRVIFAPLKVVMDVNMGIRLPHHSSQLIESTHLHSKCANSVTGTDLPALPARYSIVDQPEFGVIECLARGEEGSGISRWTMCSQFFQSDINSLAVRYRHTNANRSRADDFDFQVHCADTSSPVQILQIDFITLSIRVFVQEALSLNQTDQAVLSRKNMLATVFPQNFQPDQLVYHLLEAPKLGMLLRLMPETGKQRRVGISSNFTQQQIDDGLLSYKLHFAPFSILNDFFTFRLLSPAGASDEVFRFDIVYLPGGGIGQIRLLNRTLVVAEGGIQQISNATLWLEAADGTRKFAFRLGLPPLNGQLLLDQEGGRRALNFDDVFHSEDILKHRLFYEHAGDESQWDRIFLLAESELRDPGGGKGHTPVPFFLHISIINGNNRAPQFLQTLYGWKSAEQNNIYLIENGERTLWPWMLPLVDLDELEWPTTWAQSRFFPVAQPRHPLFFHVLPEPANSRDFVVCAKDAPEMPLREFGEEQLKSGQLILRHLGGARNVTMLKLTVNDGRHSIPVPIWMFASQLPFLRLATPSQLQFSVPPSSSSCTFLLLTIAHLWAQTNVDIPDSAILFQFLSLLPASPFHMLLPNGTFVQSWQFSQKNILENRLFYCFEEGDVQRILFLKLHIDPQPAPMDALNMPKAEELILNITFSNIPATAKSPPSIGIHANKDGLMVQQGGSSPIDANMLSLGADSDEDISAKFYVVKAPKHGEIIFQRQRKGREAAASANYNIPLLTFDKSILYSGAMQYLHHRDLARGAGEGHDDDDSVAAEDEFTLKMVIQSKRNKDFLVQIGPLSIPVHIVARNELELLPSSQPINIAPGAQITLDEHLLQPATHVDMSLVEYRIMEMSPLLTLYSRRSGQPFLDVFSHSQFVNGDVVLAAKNGSINQRVKIRLRACNSYPHRRHEKCSRPVEIRIYIRGEEKENGLILKMNDPLRINADEGDDVRITGLKVENLIVPSSDLNFLTWQHRGGFLHKASNSEPIYRFTQEDLDKGRIQFKIEDEKNKKIGFYFIFGDGITQSGPEIFTITREDKKTGSVQNEMESLVRLVRNERLQAAPGIQSFIGSDLLNTTARIHPDMIIYRVTKPPTQGRLVLTGTQGRIEHFTQSDINANRLAYQSQTNIGSWAQLDTFQFRLAISDSGKVVHQGGDVVFNVENSYSNYAMGNIPKLVPSNILRVSKGGSMAMNITHLNLTKLAEYTDEEIFLKLYRQPTHGWLERVDDMPGFRTSENYIQLSRKKNDRRKESGDEVEEENSKWDHHLTAEQLHSGSFLIYRHLLNLSSNSGEQMDTEDEFTLIAYGNSEPSRGLKLNLKIKIENGPILLKMNHLAKEVSLVSGGTLRMNANLLSASHPALPPSKIFYRVLQSPNNGIQLSVMNESLTPIKSKTTAFTQKEINEGMVVLEHIPMDDRRKWDLIGFQLDEGDRKIGHTFVLIIRLEHLALQLRNFSDITYSQGKTYVLLNRWHLGAESNGDRSLISYNITKRPENGTFYWVDGEKETSSFKQTDIDKQEVLYAQMNMNSFQDSFEFVLSNDEIELLPKKGHINVLPIFEPQTFFTNSRTITQIGLVHLNATALEGTSPRYLVVKGPEYGRLFIHPQSNESAIFFTHNDVVSGKLFFHAFDVPRRVVDNILMELRSESVQPARITWQIDIRPDGMAAEEDEMEDSDGGAYAPAKNAPNAASVTEQGGHDKVIIPPPPPDMNYHFPIAILIAVVLLVVGILLCRKKNPSDGTSVSEDDEGQKKSNGSDRGSSLKSSLKKKATEGGGEYKREFNNAGMARNPLLMGATSTIGNMKFGERGGMEAKNLLDATVYATINYRQPKEQSSNFFSSDEGGGGTGSTFDAGGAITSLIDLPFNTGTLSTTRRRDSARPTMTFSRSESKERQQLLASAVSAALASKNMAKNEEGGSQPNERIEGKEPGKNEFWV